MHNHVKFMTLIEGESVLILIVEYDVVQYLAILNQQLEGRG